MKTFGMQEDREEHPTVNSRIGMPTTGNCTFQTCLQMLSTLLNCCEAQPSSRAIQLAVDACNTPRRLMLTGQRLARPVGCKKWPQILPPHQEVESISPSLCSGPAHETGVT